MERGLPPCKLVPKLRAAVDEYRQLLPVVAAMRNSTLKERHWTKVFAAIGTVLPRDESFTLQVCKGDTTACPAAWLQQCAWRLNFCCLLRLTCCVNTRPQFCGHHGCAVGPLSLRN